MFQSVILAGGFGTRLKSVSGSTPKPMMLVGNEPFLYKLMKKLESNGCNKIILSLHYKANEIINQVENDKPVKCKVEFAIEDVPLGTGGAIKNASKYITDKKFLVLNGDTYCEINYSEILKKVDSTVMTILVTKVDDTSRYGRILLDKNLKVLKMSEKVKNTSKSGLINAGTYIIDKDAIRNYKDEIFSLEVDFIPINIDKIKAHIIETFFIDIGIPSDYFLACKKLR